MMRSSADTNTKTYLLLALLAALAVLLRLGENLLPLPMQLGGADRVWPIRSPLSACICSACA